MDEFVENFNDFRDWLYEYQERCETDEEREIVDTIIDKFEELELDTCF